MALSRRTFLASISGLALLTPGSVFGAPRSPMGPRFALRGTVIPGNGPPLKDHLVLVDTGTIEAIVPTRIITDRPVISLPQATILPGVINCHVHRIHSATERRERYLKHGVTAIGDAASPLTALAELLDSPAGTTATARCAGPMLCPPGGYPLPVHSPEHAFVVTSLNHGREVVRQLANSGATMLKIAFEPGPYATPWPMFDTTTAQAICNEARRENMTIRCHVEDLGGLEPALNAGVHTIEHVPHRWIVGDTRKNVLRDDGLEHAPTEYYEALLEQMVRENIILTPTLDVLSRSIWNGPELTIPVKRFADMGGSIAVGNDYPYRRTDAGMPLREMELLGTAGLDNTKILEGSTRVSAMACGFSNRGVLAPGMAADLLMVRGDPLSDLTVLSSPSHIIKDGEFFK